MHDVRGRSLAGRLRGEADGAGNAVVISECAGEWSDPPGRMVRRGPWKLVWYHGYDRPQLFNLERDPDEWHDLGADPSAAAVRDGLSAILFDGWDPAGVAQLEQRLRADRARPGTDD